jgi:predicted DCC family thiol-disulfide oxidoreductase YuxK
MTDQGAPMTGQGAPILLFDDQCGVCRRIGRWVQKSAQRQAGGPSIVTRPIGNDPEALRALKPDLDIWEAYATIHLLMPDGSMKRGGEAVAEVLRRLPNTRWFAWLFAVGIFRFRPFQSLLNLAYTILAAVRPFFGCESCGTPSFRERPIGWIVERAKATFGGRHRRSQTAHFSSNGEH